VPFLKIDKGLQDRQWDVQLMRDIPGLDQLLERAREGGVFGTKARSVIHAAEPDGVARVVQQQVELGDWVLDAGLVPILEPRSASTHRTKRMGSAKVGVKVTIPTIDAFYSDLIAHPNVAGVVALSGGYSRDDANERLRRDPGLIASPRLRDLHGHRQRPVAGDGHTTSADPFRAGGITVASLTQ